MMGKPLPGIIPGSVLTFTSVVCDSRVTAFYFTMDPPIPNPLPDGRAFEYLQWRIEVTDDIGTVYGEEWVGGAAGTTDGDMAMPPPVPREARELTVIIQPHPRCGDEPRYQFTIDESSISRVDNATSSEAIRHRNNSHGMK